MGNEIAQSNYPVTFFSHLNDVAAGGVSGHQATLWYFVVVPRGDQDLVEVATSVHPRRFVAQKLTHQRKARRNECRVASLDIQKS